MIISKELKKTEIGIIPHNWQIEELEKLCQPNGLVRGPFGSTLRKEFFINSGYKVYEQKNAIKRDSDIGHYYIDEKKYSELSRFRVVPGDFIISCSGTIGKIFRLPENAQAGVINQALLKISLDRKKINERFFYYYFDWSIFQKRIIENTQGGAMQNLIGMSEFRNIDIPVPPLNEQRAIAEVLSDVDALIEAQEALIEKKRLIKQGVMQELLTGKRRLPGFSDKWELVKIEEIAEVLKGKGLSKSELTSTGMYKSILYGELFTTYDEVIDHVYSSTDSNQGELSEYGDVLMPGSTTTIGVDLCKASALLFEQILLGGDINIIRSKSRDRFSPEFFAYYLTHMKKDDIDKAAQGITIIHLYGKDIKKVTVSLPPLNEQIEIVHVIKDIDKEIEFLEEKTNKLFLLKQGMMQELLTGSTRLV